MILQITLPNNEIYYLTDRDKLTKDPGKAKYYSVKDMENEIEKKRDQNFLRSKINDQIKIKFTNREVK